MPHCAEIQLELVDLLHEDVTPERRAELTAHVGECSACRGELDSLRQAWIALPTPGPATPPLSSRSDALAYARRSIEQPHAVLGGRWRAMKGIALPAAIGSAGTAVFVLLLHLRGGMAPLTPTAVAAFSVILAASLAFVAGALWRNISPPRVRAVLLGSVGALGGYVLLTGISPISETVQICRLALFRNVPMSLGEVCLVYLAVAVLYAGVPMGVSAYVGRGANTWRAGLAEAGIFVLLAAPTAVLQMGLEESFITLTVLAGLGMGSLAGGLGGTWIRFRRMAGATG